MKPERVLGKEECKFGISFREYFSASEFSRILLCFLTNDVNGRERRKNKILLYLIYRQSAREELRDYDTKKGYMEFSKI